MLKKTLSFLVLLAMSACTCVTDINTPRDVVPTEFANILFINSHPDMENMRIKLNGKVFIDQLNYKVQDTNYRKSDIGNIDLEIFDLKDTSLVYRSYVNLKKEQSYTIVFYGSNKRVEEIYLEDTLSSLIHSNSYFRTFHLSPDAPNVIVELKDAFGNSINQALSYHEKSNIAAFPTGPLEINIYDSTKTELYMKLPAIEFKPGTFYKILLRGYFGIGHQNRLNCTVIGNEFVKQ